MTSRIHNDHPSSYVVGSTLGLDLRAEPMVITVPPIEKSRYYSVQLIGVIQYFSATPTDVAGWAVRAATA